MSVSVVECVNEDLLAVEFASGWESPLRIRFAEVAYGAILDAIETWIVETLNDSADTGHIVSMVWRTEYEGEPQAPESLGQIRCSLVWCAT